MLLEIRAHPIDLRAPAGRGPYHDRDAALGKKDEQFNKARECETKILKTVTIFFYAFKIAHCL